MAEVPVQKVLNILRKDLEELRWDNVLLRAQIQQLEEGASAGSPTTPSADLSDFEGPSPE